MEVFTSTQYVFKCTKCGEKRVQTNLVEGLYLQCWNCGQRFFKDTSGQWQPLKESDTEIALRKAGKR